MADTTLVHEEGINKNTYDRHCAERRLQDSHLRDQLLNIVGDANGVDRVLNLVNDHQSACTKPSDEHPASDELLTAVENPNQAFQPTQWDNSAAALAIPPYEPLPDLGVSLGGTMLSCDGSSFTPFDPLKAHDDPNGSTLDSGFISGLTAPGETALEDEPDDASGWESD